MDALTAELARLAAERRRLQRQVQRQRAKEGRQWEQALQAATIAFCHEPTAGATLASATLRKFPRCLDGDVDACAHEIEDRFLQTPVAVLAQWLDWTGDVPPSTLAEAKRLVQDARLVSWVGEQNSAQELWISYESEYDRATEVKQHIVKEPVDAASLAAQMQALAKGGNMFAVKL